MDIKAVDDVSTKVADGELEAEVKEDRDEATRSYLLPIRSSGASRLAKDFWGMKTAARARNPK